MDAVRNDNVAGFVLESVLKIKIAPPFSGFVILDDRGMICGAFAFTEYTGPNIELTIMCDLPLTMRIVRFIARLAFIELKAERIQVHTETGNARAIIALESLKFRFEGVARRYFGDRDALTYALLREEQKVLRHAIPASA